MPSTAILTPAKPTTTWDSVSYRGSRRRVRDISLAKRLIATIIYLVFAGVVIGLNWFTKGSQGFFLGMYGSVILMYLTAKILLSLFYRPSVRLARDFKVSVIIPMFNEAPEAVRKLLDSILGQNYGVDEIFVVDDGSADAQAFEAVLEIAAVNPSIIAHRFEANQGKRRAQVWALRRAAGEIFITVDSDTILLPGSIRELVKPFAEEKVVAVTGHLNALNRDHNLLTRLIDMRYQNAFRVERAAQSVFGSVLVCSGPLSAYRRDIILPRLDDYENQTFLGVDVQYGDDRRLTNYALAQGRVVYQATARGLTDVPESLKGFLKQQTRWNRSFFRESLYALRLGFKRPGILMWVGLELGTWLGFNVALVYSVLSGGRYIHVLLAYYLCYIMLMALARNAIYIFKNPLTFLLAPLYGLIHVTLLMPIRLYSLATLKSSSWETRGAAGASSRSWRTGVKRLYAPAVLWGGLVMVLVATATAYASL
jgi:hyaluronan synthase